MKGDCTPLFGLDVRRARFNTRLSRFSGQAQLDGEKLVLHITNTGKLTDLLVEGAEILYIPKKSHKTAGTLVGVVVGEHAALIDTRLQSKAFETAFNNGLIQWLKGLKMVGREVVVGKTRLDYVFADERGGKTFVELKSAVYLREDGAAMYPDTVSMRGRRHIQLLESLRKQNPSIIVFVAAHPLAKFFTPCDEGDPKIRKLLLKAAEAGVEVRAVKTHMDVFGTVYWCSSNLPVFLT
ncbi:MAG: DNA/RNA nuclease SfsA [Candidatus Caldarchaeum sp.]